jgi:hydrogenase maturation protease
VMDAVSSGARPGTIHRLDAAAGPIPVRFGGSSTHAFSVGEAVELGRALDRLPRRLVVFGVEGASFDAGDRLAPDVERALEEIVDAALGEIDAMLGREPSP